MLVQCLYLRYPIWGYSSLIFLYVSIYADLAADLAADLVADLAADLVADLRPLLMDTADLRLLMLISSQKLGGSASFRNFAKTSECLLCRKHPLLL